MLRTFMNKPLNKIHQTAFTCSKLQQLPLSYTATVACVAQNAIKAQLRPFHLSGCYFSLMKTQHSSVSLQKKNPKADN